MISPLAARPMTATALRTLAQPQSPAQAPAPPAQDAPERPSFPVGKVVMNTLSGAAGGALAGYLGGTMGGVIGGIDGLGVGGRLGWNAGRAMALSTAEKTGQGKINPVAGGIASLTIPLATASVGAVAGAAVGVWVGATMGPLVGAAAGGGVAFAAEMVSWAIADRDAREAAHQP